MDFSPSVIILILVVVLVAIALFVNRRRFGFGREKISLEKANALASKYLDMGKHKSSNFSL